MIKRLLWYEPLWLLVLGLPVLFPQRLTPWIAQPDRIAALLLFWPLRACQTFPPHFQSAISLTALALLVWLPVTIFISSVTPTAWQAAGYLVYGLALFVACIHWPPFQRRPRRMAVLFVGCALGIGVIGFWALAPFDRLIPLRVLLEVPLSLLRHLDDTVNPNVLAGAIVLAVPLSFSLAFTAHAPEPPNGTAASVLRLPTVTQIGWFGCAALLTLVLIATECRGALIGLGAALITMLLAYRPKLLLLTPIIGVLCIAAIALYGPERAISQALGGTALANWSEREQIWSCALHSIQTHPFTGIGIGAFGDLNARLCPNPPELSAEVHHAHQLVLQIAVDLGIPGLIMAVALWGGAVVLALQAIRRQPRLVTGELAIGALAGLAAMATHGLIDATVWGNKLAFMPWILLATITLLAGKQCAETAEP